MPHEFVTTPWKLEGFIEALDRWIERENPHDDLRLAVTSWVLSRADDPYQGVKRERGYDNLWYGVVPKSLHGDNMIVLCSYWVYESRHAVRCDQIATLNYPV